MNLYIRKSLSLLSAVSLILLASCATLPQHLEKNNQFVYLPDNDETIIRRHLPIFIIENANEKHNLIGTPSARVNREGKEEIFINTKTPSIYSEIRSFSTLKDSYTNLIYRIHFEKIPFSFAPFSLSAGKNVGLIVVVTLNNEGAPILYTTVQTCGCYLAFIPTSYMSKDAFPEAWNMDRQTVYGENLPGLLDLDDVSLVQSVTLILIKDSSHRVKDISVSTVDSLKRYTIVKAMIQPLQSLQSLSLNGEDSTSFYENSGSRKGYVKDSSKPWERLLISWWAFDWRVGQDKKFGRDKEGGPVFYTSLKPWARNDSDMRNFPAFLKYWGWKL